MADRVNTDKLMNYLVGQVMKKLRNEGKCASPTLVRSILEEILEEEYQKTIKTEESKNS